MGAGWEIRWKRVATVAHECAVGSKWGGEESEVSPSREHLRPLASSQASPAYSAPIFLVEESLEHHVDITSNQRQQAVAHGAVVQRVAAQVQHAQRARHAGVFEHLGDGRGPS